ncbi:MAG: sensor histidine kinase [Acidobacteriota bacterium]
MRLSIKVKIITAYTLLFGTVLVGFAFVIYRTIHDNELNRIDSSLKSYSAILQSELEEQISDERAVNIAEVNSIKAEGLQDVRLSLVDRHGSKIMFDSLTGQAGGWNEMVGGKNVLVTSPISRGEHYRSLITGVEVNGDTLYVLQVATSLKEMDQALERLWLVFLLVIPLALLLAGSAAYLIAKTAFRPVLTMAQTARRISAKSLESRLELPREKDEIHILGSTLNEMLDRIDRYLKSQKQFIADAAHEIRTPLTVLQSELELIDREITDRSQKESVRTALTEIESLTKLTSALLTLVRLDSSQNAMVIDHVCVDDLVTECVRLMRSAAEEKKITFDLQIDEPVQIRADKDKLRSVFLNLIDNAVKYSFPHSIIRIEMIKTAAAVRITVQNFGIQIDLSELPMIFNRFYRSTTVQSVAKGNGLGLPIAKEFIEMHQGSIAVESTEADGTRFIVDLPL